MKLLISCLVLAATVFYIVDSAAAERSHHSHHSHSKSSQKATYKYLDIDCPNLDIEEFVNSGTFQHYESSKRADFICKIRIHGPPGSKVNMNVLMSNAGGGMFPDCTDGGQLDIYSGGDATGTRLVSACDALPFKKFTVDNNQVFLSYVPNDNWRKKANNFVVEFSFTTSRQQLKETRAESLLDELKELLEKKDLE